MFEERSDLIDEIARELRRTPVASPASRARIVAAVRREASRRRRGARLWRSIVAPRMLRMSPLAGITLAAAVALVIASRWMGAAGRAHGEVAAGAPERGAPAAGAQAPATEGPRLVQFVLVVPGARRVSLVGDFNGWDAQATPLATAASARGVWAAEVPLAPGRHVYAYVIDDSTWMPDPAAARAPRDDFGNPNSVIVVGDGT